MRVDLPECGRCCFCLPLRKGVLTYGYISLVSFFCQLIFKIHINNNKIIINTNMIVIFLKNQYININITLRHKRSQCFTEWELFLGKITILMCILPFIQIDKVL